MSINSARRAALRNAGTVSSLVNALPSSIAIDILVNDRAAFTVVDAEGGNRVNFVELPADNPITIWPQDPFLVLRSDDPNQPATLLMSKSFERAGDASMARYFAEQNGFDILGSSLHFEGGNIVSDEKHILIGANTIRFNALERGVPDNDIGLAFQDELGKPALVIGPFPQPVAHIDMMITPLGNSRIALADARLGLKIAEAALADDPDSVRAFEDHCREFFFGHPEITHIKQVNGDTIEPPDLEGMTRELLAHNRDIAPVLDGIASALASLGYEMLRIPFYFGGPELRPLNGSENEGSVASYPMLTYNNVLLESRAGESRVYLPEYGWPAFDDAAQAAWRDAGFTPFPVQGLTTSAMYGGALRCTVKVLERG
ncbi:hypothetical protein [Seongchinamella sediminis]|nr:hypothetical protein [Seongchinamella sediminis]